MSEFSRYKLRCRRGMKELDVVLERYLNRHFAQATVEEKRYLDELLDLQDPVLFGIVFGLDPMPDAYQAVVEKMRSL